MPESPNSLPPEVDRLIALLRDARGKCEKIVLDPPGKNESQRTFERSRASSMLNQLNRELDALKPIAAKVSKQAIDGSFKQGLKDAEAQLKEAGVASKGSSVAGSFSLVDTRRAEVLSRDTMDNLGKAVDSMKRVTGQAVRQIQALGLDDKQVNQLIARGTIDGSEADHTALRKLVRKVADGKMIETVNKKTGAVTTFKPDDYADLVYQTKTSEATRIATTGRLSDKGIKRVKIQGRVSRNFCTAFLGKVYSLEAGDSTYPALSSLPNGGPPFHPRCSKYIVAFIEQLASAKQIAAAQPDDATEELIGKDSTEAAKAYRAQQAEAK